MTRIIKTVTFNLTDKGLGISIIGNIIDNQSVIFVRSISPSGLASLDGRLQEGDQIISVNGESLDSVSCDDAVKLLKIASEDGFVQLKICRDFQAREKYKEVCEMYSFPDQNNPNSVLQEIRDDTKYDDNILRKTPSAITYNEPQKSLNKNMVNLERLLQSLSFLGIVLNEDEEAEMKSNLVIDSDGNVSYDDFVNISKELYSNHMKRANNPTISLEQTKVYGEGSAMCLPSSGKHNDLVLLVNKKNETILKLEKEILRHKNELHGLREELRDAKSRLKLCEEAQKAARKTEEDYELVFRCLEKNNLKKVNSPEPNEGVELLRLQCKKSDTSNKLLRTANEKLFDFTKFVAGALKKREEQLNIHEALKKSLPNPVHLDFSSSDRVILFEAIQTIKAVETLLDIEARPRDNIPTKETAATGAF